MTHQDGRTNEPRHLRRQLHPRGILNGVKSIAMVGASPVNVRPSYFAFKYLAQRGYDMIPVNPGHVGKEPARQTLRRLAVAISAVPST